MDNQAAVQALNAGTSSNQADKLSIQRIWKHIKQQKATVEFRYIKRSRNLATAPTTQNVAQLLRDLPRFDLKLLPGKVIPPEMRNSTKNLSSGEEVVNWASFMESEGFIQRCSPDYPEVVTRHWAVPKKDGRWRIVGNFTALNRLTCKDFGKRLDPLQLVKELSQYRYKSKLDLVNGFYLVRTTPNAEKMLGINIEGQMYVYRRMPMGTSGSPGVFSWFIPKLLSLLPTQIHRNVLIYQDDLLIGGATPQQVTTVIHEIEKVLKHIGAQETKRSPRDNHERQSKHLGTLSATKPSPWRERSYVSSRNDSWKPSNNAN